MKRIPKAAMFVGVLALGCNVVGTANAQTTKAPAKSTTAPAKDKKLPDGFILLPSGLEYKIVKHGKGTHKPIISDHIEMNIHVHEKDSVIFDSRKMNDGKSVPLAITAPKYKGDLNEGFMLMVAGDSAIFRVSVDSIKKLGGMQPWMKEGEKIEYNVALISVKSDAEDKKEAAEHVIKQKGVDEILLQEYFTKHNIKPIKTASGLYYIVSNEGSGVLPKMGQTVDVNYTGMFLSGEKFDSNTDSNFHHLQPLQVEVGKGRVIKGWDEGLLLLKKGAKATFYIPSNLAYGPTERKPIPANAILMFEVEIVDIEDPMNQKEKDDKALTDYFAKNNIKATKTPSGLYIRIIQDGTGEAAKPGQKVSMRYLGKTLDGQVFDGNMDEHFTPKAGNPFAFTLGVGQVIKGWDEGVSMLKKGTRATLYIPSALGYGERGSPPRIAPNADLIFDVEVENIEQ